MSVTQATELNQQLKDARDHILGAYTAAATQNPSDITRWGSKHPLMQSYKKGAKIVTSVEQRLGINGQSNVPKMACSDKHCTCAIPLLSPPKTTQKACSDKACTCAIPLLSGPHTTTVDAKPSKKSKKGTGTKTPFGRFW